MSMSREALLHELLTSAEIESWQANELKYFGPTTRAISFFNDITRESSLHLVSQLLHLEEEDGEAPVTLYLNTGGGSMIDGLAIYDTIVNLSCPVLIYVTGLCASAGLMVLCAGDCRIATESSTFYYHEPVLEEARINSSKELDELQKYYTFCKEKMNKIIRSKTKLKKKKWESLFENKTAYYLSAGEALGINLIDKIAESNKVNFDITGI